MTIEIRDIFVVPTPSARYGEYHLPPEKISSREEGITALISYISQKANEIHISYNYDPITGSMKADCENKITRLSFIEFAFYTKKTPLSLEEFILIKKNIYNLARGLSNNLHLVLCSFPVAVRKITDENQQPGYAYFRNETLYVQCGELCEMRSFYKNLPSLCDPDYNYYDAWELDISLKKEKDKSVKEEIKNKGGVFIFKTFGQKEAWMVLEICLEHSVGQGLKKLNIEYNREKKIRVTVPEHVSHLLTANSLGFESENSVSMAYSHIDPISYYRGQWVTNQDGRFTKQKYAYTEELDIPQAIGAFGYRQVKIEVTESLPLPQLFKPPIKHYSFWSDDKRGALINETGSLRLTG